MFVQNSYFSFFFFYFVQSVGKKQLFWVFQLWLLYRQKPNALFARWLFLYAAQRSVYGVVADVRKPCTIYLVVRSCFIFLFVLVLFISVHLCDGAFFKISLFSGWRSTLFAKFWLVCRLVRLGNVCALCRDSYLPSNTFKFVYKRRNLLKYALFFCQILRV
jgi:hypothetical protein